MRVLTGFTIHWRLAIRIGPKFLRANVLKAADSETGEHDHTEPNRLGILGKEDKVFIGVPGSAYICKDAQVQNVDTTNESTNERVEPQRAVQTEWECVMATTIAPTIEAIENNEYDQGDHGRQIEHHFDHAGVVTTAIMCLPEVAHVVSHVESDC